MDRFPKDASRARVVAALETLGFQIVREREHVAMLRRNADGTNTPLTLQITRRSSLRRCGSFADRVRSREKIFQGHTKSRDLAPATGPRFNDAMFHMPDAMLARATAGITQIVASRQRQGIFAIEASHTSPIATVTSSTH